jgi:hypothetical protein
MTEINELLSELKGAILDINDKLKKAFQTIGQLQADLSAAREANASEFKRGQDVFRKKAKNWCFKSAEFYLSNFDSSDLVKAKNTLAVSSALEKAACEIDEILAGEC